MTRRISFFLLMFTAASLGAQVTESPMTVARGDWLLEADLASISFHREAVANSEVRGTSAVIGAVFLSTGLAERVDIQVGTELYHRDRVSGPGFREVVSGRGDTYLRAKWNVSGDEAEEPAFAVLPWVKFPTAADGVGNDETDWGVILPVGVPIAGGGVFNAMVEFARPADGEGGRESTWFLGAVVVMPLRAAWQWYAETTAGFVSKGQSASTATIGGGLRYEATPGFVIDVGLAAGLTSETDDWNPVIRVEWGF